MRDPYLYEKTNVLKNKFGEQSEREAAGLEAHFVASRLHDIVLHPVDGSFDYEHLCAIHYFIFQDMYEWAGQARIIQIEKNEPLLGGLSVEYSRPENIVQETSTILAEMCSTPWEDLNTEQKAVAFAKQMTALWKIHPFREGNTRTVITFCCQFADCQEFSLDQKLFKEHSDYVRIALVAASAPLDGLTDRSQPQHIARIVYDAIDQDNH